MNTPHVVKFSGGRSSGMMLIRLLEQKVLKPERGDVIVFNNTSAEHPATYEFTRRMKLLAEREYNIPFFWIEHQTYEDASRHGWRRKPTYRLVNERPYTRKNKDGYRFKGEVYEEMISLDGFLPNMHARTCTKALKIFTTNSFLSDWLAQKTGIERLGHYRETTRINDNDVIDTHKKHQGATPDKILLAKRKFVRKCDFVRKEYLWKDFTNSDLCFDNDAIKGSVIGNKGKLFGDIAITYVSYLGIRKDEEVRAKKIRSRVEYAKKEGRGEGLSGQPHNEIVVVPLVDDGITKEDVIEFWRKQEFNLDLPEDGLFSNCVYCPLKGKAKILEIAKKEKSSKWNLTNTPASIDWWIKMEKKYSRNLKAEKRHSKKYINFIGFFGESKDFVYKKIKEQANQDSCRLGEDVKAEYLVDEDYIPCNCTD